MVRAGSVVAKYAPAHRALSALVCFTEGRAPHQEVGAFGRRDLPAEPVLQVELPSKLLRGTLDRPERYNAKLRKERTRGRRGNGTSFGRQQW